MSDENKTKKIGGVRLEFETYVDNLTRKPVNTRIYAPKTQDGWRALCVVGKILADKTSAIPQRIETHDTFGLDIQPYNGNEQYVNKDKLNLASAIPENIDVFLAPPHVPIRMDLATLERLYKVANEPMHRPKEVFRTSDRERRAAKIYVEALRRLLDINSKPTHEDVNNSLIKADLSRKTSKGVVIKSSDPKIMLNILFGSKASVKKYVNPVMELLQKNSKPDEAELEQVIIETRRIFLGTRSDKESRVILGPDLL